MICACVSGSFVPSLNKYPCVATIAFLCEYFCKTSFAHLIVSGFHSIPKPMYKKTKSYCPIVIKS